MKVEQLVVQKESLKHSIHPDAPLSEALQIFADKHLEALMVIDEQQHIEKIISKNDIMYTYSTSHQRALPMTLNDVMTPHKHLIVAWKGDDDVRDILGVMVEKEIRHLLIMHEGKVCAFVSIDDVMEAFVADIADKMDFHFSQGKYSSVP